MLWDNGHYKYFTLSVRESTLDVRIWSLFRRLKSVYELKGLKRYFLIATHTFKFKSKMKTHLFCEAFNVGPKTMTTHTHTHIPEWTDLRFLFMSIQHNFNVIILASYEHIYQISLLRAHERPDPALGA